MKRYEGHHRPGGQTVVLIKDDEGREGLLEHHVRHSPDGFSWGYPGSGPAELARCLLWDHLGTEPHPACYQAFKAAYPAQWPQDAAWTLTAGQIEQWLESWSATEAAGGGQGYATMAGYEAWMNGASPSEAAAIDNQRATAEEDPREARPLTAAELARRITRVADQHPDAPVFAYLGPEGLMVQAEPKGGTHPIRLLSSPLRIASGGPVL